MPVNIYSWAIQEKLFAKSNQDSTVSHTLENSKMFNITSKHLSRVYNKDCSYNAQLIFFIISHGLILRLEKTDK